MLFRSFAREVTCDHGFGEVSLRKGDRALMLYACANRDPSKYPDAERFDITRRPSDQLGFGFGTHVCAGMHLAKLELTVLLETLLLTVSGFETEAATRRPHNTLRGLASILTRFVVA